MFKYAEWLPAFGIKNVSGTHHEHWLPLRLCSFLCAIFTIKSKYVDDTCLYHTNALETRCGSSQPVMNMGKTKELFAENKK